MSRYLIISRAFDVRETRHRAHGFPGCRDRPRGEAILRYLKEVGSPGWIRTSDHSILERAHCSRIGFTEWPRENQTPTKFRG